MNGDRIRAALATCVFILSAFDPHRDQGTVLVAATAAGWAIYFVLKVMEPEPKGTTFKADYGEPVERSRFR